MNLDLIIRNLLIKYPRLFNLIQKTKFNLNTEFRTAATNGKVININPNFMCTLTEDEQAFIIMHELCHILFNHTKRSKNKIDKYWNISTDAVINANLEHDGFKIPENGVNMPEAYGYDAEEFYEILLKRYNVKHLNSNEDLNADENELNENNSNEDLNADENELNENNSNEDLNTDKNETKTNNSNENELNENNSNEDLNTDKNETKTNNSNENELNENNSNEDLNTDENELNENNSNEDLNADENETKTNNSNENELNENNSNEDLNANENELNNDSTSGQEMDEYSNDQSIDDLTDITNHNEEWNIGEKYDDSIENNDESEENDHTTDEKNFFEENERFKKQMLKDMKKAIQKSLEEAANNQNAQKFTMDSINNVGEEIDWRSLLKKFEKNDIDWSYKNAIIEDGIITSNLEDLPKSETEILLDTSGSISRILLKNFLGECKNILKSSNLKVGCFDTKFYGFKTIRSDKDINEMVYCGGGGTDFSAAINAFTGRVDNMIIFTDGCASMPYTSKNIIWIVFGDRKINPAHGSVIYISDAQYKKLNNGDAEHKSHNLFR